MLPFSSSLVPGLLVERALQGLPTSSLVVDNLLISSPPLFFFRIFAILFADLLAVRQITVRSDENRFAVSPIIPITRSWSLASQSGSRSSNIWLSLDEAWYRIKWKKLKPRKSQWQLRRTDDKYLHLCNPVNIARLLNMCINWVYIEAVDQWLHTNRTVGLSTKHLWTCLHCKVGLALFHTELGFVSSFVYH